MISHQVDHFDESDHEFGGENLNDSDEDDPSPYTVFHSSFNSTEPKKPTKVLILTNLGEMFQEAAKQMIIEYNKKLRVANPRRHFNGGKTKRNAT